MNRKDRRSKDSQKKSQTPAAPDPLWGAFQEGMGHQQAGRLSEAQAIYQKILTLNPRHAHSLHMMGLIAMDVQKPEVAEELIKKAIAEQDNFALFYSSLANSLNAQKKNEEAAAAYEKALALKPDFADCLSNYGALLLRTGQKDRALEFFKRTLAINPQHINTLNNMGVIAQSEKRNTEARQYFECAIATKPDFAEAYKNLGLLLKQSGDLEEAKKFFEQALKHKPDYLDALSDLANVLRDLQQFAEAKRYYEHVAKLRPDGFSLANIASILKLQGDIPGALEYYMRAIALAPENFEILNNLGAVQNQIGRYSEAAATYKQAIALQPASGVVLSNLGTTLKNLGQLDESIGYLKQALVQSNDHGNIYSNLLLTMLYAAGISPEELTETAKKFGNVVDDLRRVRRFSNNKNPERKLRIGYVSPDFFNHAVHYFFEPLLTLHDRSKFETYGYSNTANEDNVTERIKSKFDHWRDIRYIGNEAAADLIENDQIDILVDIAGHTGRNRLPIFAFKPAPVQVTWLGYPATTGMKTMDYRISDPYAEPPGMTEHLNVETLWRLPEVFCCYQANEKSPAVIDHPPFEDNGYVMFGCFNNFSKVTDDVLLTWSKIMARVPESRLTLEIAGLQEPEFHLEVIKRLQNLGLPMERMLLLPRCASHQFALYNKIDMALDPFPCAGGTTSMDTLWMGVPFVSLEGRHFVSRMGVTILTNAGMPELIAKNIDEYVEIAASLANDRERLKKLRHGLRERFAASPVMNQKNFAHNMETAYREMWRKWCAEDNG